MTTQAMTPTSARSPLGSQLLGFALVGGIGFVVDVSSFTLLRTSTLFQGSPLKAGLISTLLAIATNWLGNRYWTFRHHRSPARVREAVEFAVVSSLGMLVALACLAVSHYLLDLRTVLADNIAKNGVGLLLGSALRFALYRSWVYRPHRTRAMRAADSVSGSGSGFTTSRCACRSNDEVGSEPITRVL